jgi:hypothetical protein
LKVTIRLSHQRKIKEGIKMKNCNFFLIALFFSLMLTAAYSQTLNEIIDLHFDAAKQDKFNKLETIITTAKISQGDLSGLQKIFHKRRGKIRIERTINKQTTITAYDGKIGWEILPGDSTAHLLNGRKLEEIKFEADLDGYFFCWREKSHHLELKGLTKEDGKKVFNILCTKDNGDNADLYMDAKTYLLIKTIQRIGENGAQNIKETLISNYKNVGGIPFPYRYVIISNNVKEIQTVEKILLDEKISDEIFTMPKSI